MAEEVLLKMLLENLFSMLLKEVELVRGFKKDLEKLGESLRSTQAFLHDAEKKEITSEIVEDWLKRLEDAAFEGDAVLDEINYNYLRQTQKVRCSSFSSGFPSMRFRRKMASEIKGVISKLDAINKEARGKGLVAEKVLNAPDASAEGLVAKEVLNAPDAIVVGKETDSFCVEENIVGREKDEEKIVHIIMEDAPQEKTISVISIAGMGGLGKTTLARKIFHHGEITTHFGERIWVCVSFKFDELILFQLILKTLTGEAVGDGVGVKEVLLGKIQKILRSKRYLLVLDDVWNKDPKKWGDFMKSLSGISDVKQNVIIVTTRDTSVASMVQTVHTYGLSNLSVDDCWSIISARSGVDDPHQFEETGKSIARKCGGLPLAAEVLGGLLRDKTETEWSSILNNQLSNFGQDEISVNEILKLSYNRLPSSTLKRCFAYCSVFPQDYSIEKEYLIKLWMAEGFLPADNQENDLESVGNRFFNHLLQASLFQDLDRDDYGNITHCRMHDLVHDLACSVSGSKPGRIDERANTNKLRYLYVDTDEKSCVSREGARYMRTLILSPKVEYTFFSGINFSCLHALTLQNSDITELPAEIGNQIHLRFLDISETGIKKLPDFVSKLFNLEVLMVRRGVKLPGGITNLLKMRHLHIDDTELPSGLRKLTSLRTLPYYRVGIEEGCKIGELGDLKNLKGELKIHKLERVSDQAEAMQADLFGKPSIFKLILVWDESKESDKNVLEGLQPHPSLKSLEIHGYGGRDLPLWAKKMRVYNAISRRWLGFINMKEIKIIGCHQCEEIPDLGHLPCLKRLVIEDLHNLRAIGLLFYGLENCGSSSSANDNVDTHEKVTAFPALERLKLLTLPNLTEWVDVGEGADAFPSLEELSISECSQLKIVPSCFPHLERLDIHDTSIDFSLPDAFRGTRYLRRLEISRSPELINLPYEFCVNNKYLSYIRIDNCRNFTGLVRIPSMKVGTESSFLQDISSIIHLKELWICDCPELKSLFCVGFRSLEKLVIERCDGLTNISGHVLNMMTSAAESSSPEEELTEDLSSALGSLKFLSISDCPELKSIPYVGFKSLEYLEIKYCRGLTTLECELLESSASRLSYLHLENLESLINLVPGISRMSRLKTLVLLKLPKLMNFPRENIDCLRSLSYLRFGGFSELVDMESINEYLQWQEHQSLLELKICEQPHWHSLPDQIQHLSSVEWLTLDDVGLEALQEWLGNLSSLIGLYIDNCKKLRHFPSVEAMQRLTRLEFLRMNNCPIMWERCMQKRARGPGAAAASDDSEWPKISHIPYVRIDGRQPNAGRVRRCAMRSIFLC